MKMEKSTTLRDCFSRELSRIKNLNLGPKLPEKVHVYYNQLLFLKPIIQYKPTETDITSDAVDSGGDLGGFFNTNNILNYELSSKEKKC